MTSDRDRDSRSFHRGAVRAGRYRDLEFYSAFFCAFFGMMSLLLVLGHRSGFIIFFAAVMTVCFLWLSLYFRQRAREVIADELETIRS